jgi:hypothetical protein
MCCRHPRKGTGMTREEIIRMAREAGINEATSEFYCDELQRFAALVAAREREQIALMIERSIDLTGLNDWPVWQRFIGELLVTTAELIRARGKND